MLETSFSFCNFTTLINQSKTKFMKKTNLVLRFNDGVVDSFKGKKELVKWFEKRGVSNLVLSDDGEGSMVLEEGEEYSISEGVDMLIENGSIGLCMVCWNEIVSA